MCWVSPWLASYSIVRSACWVLVGNPVEGPTLLTSQITPGTSAKYESPINSDIKEIPGPLVHVMPRPPAQPAPITIPAAASSSSAWITAQVEPPSSASLSSGSHLIMPSARDDDGVIGYQDNMLIPPKIEPNAIASLPSTKKLSGSLSLLSTQYGIPSPQFSAA